VKTWAASNGKGSSPPSSDLAFSEETKPREDNTYYPADWTFHVTQRQYEVYKTLPTTVITLLASLGKGTHFYKPILSLQQTAWASRQPSRIVCPLGPPSHLKVQTSGTVQVQQKSSAKLQRVQWFKRQVNLTGVNNTAL